MNSPDEEKQAVLERNTSPAMVPIHAASDFPLVARHKQIGGAGMHWHDHCEIELVLGGEGVQVLNGETFPIRRGSVFFCGPTDFHSITHADPDGQFELYSIGFSDASFTGEYLNKLIAAPTNKCYVLDDLEFEYSRAAMELIWRESESPAPYSHQLIRGQMDTLFCLLLRAMEKTTPDLKGDPLVTESQVMLYIHSHFAQSPSLSEVAAIALQSPSHFSRCFEKRTGCTYTRYLMQLKLRYAVRLLLLTRIPIASVSRQAGFPTLSYFYKIFRENYGVTPQEYRERNAKGDFS